MLGSMGCNPDQTWQRADGADGPGATLGSLGYSHGGGLFLCVHASGAIRKWSACYLHGNYRATEGTDTDARPGVPVVIPQIAIANNHYGWALVAGQGRVRSDGAVRSGHGYSFTNAANKEGELDEHAGTTGWLGGMFATANDGANDGPCILMFPTVLN